MTCSACASGSAPSEHSVGEHVPERDARQRQIIALIAQREVDAEVRSLSRLHVHAP